MAEKTGTLGYKVLCWNRGKEGVVVTKQAWGRYLVETTETDPDIVFLRRRFQKVTVYLARMKNTQQ